MPLPFFGSLSCLRFPLRSESGHRNRDARAAQYKSISPYPIGAHYSVRAQRVLTNPIRIRRRRQLPRSCCQPCHIASILKRTSLHLRICISIGARYSVLASLVLTNPIRIRRRRQLPRSCCQFGHIASILKRTHLHFYRRSLFRPRFARPYESHKD